MEQTQTDDRVPAFIRRDAYKDLSAIIELERQLGNKRRITLIDVTSEAIAEKRARLERRAARKMERQTA